VGFRQNGGNNKKEILIDGFHLFQRVVGFRQVKSFKDLAALKDGFHLFQRVVGFRLVYVTNAFSLNMVSFPSLSESSGFPTQIF